jgi:hypothetical protein
MTFDVARTEIAIQRERVRARATSASSSKKSESSSEMSSSPNLGTNRIHEVAHQTGNLGDTFLEDVELPVHASESNVTHE